MTTYGTVTRSITHYTSCNLSVNSRSLTFLPYPCICFSAIFLRRAAVVHIWYKPGSHRFRGTSGSGHSLRDSLQIMPALPLYHSFLPEMQIPAPTSARCPPAVRHTVSSLPHKPVRAVGSVLPARSHGLLLPAGQSSTVSSTPPLRSASLLFGSVPVLCGSANFFLCSRSSLRMSFLHHSPGKYRAVCNFLSALSVSSFP